MFKVERERGDMAARAFGNGSGAGSFVAVTLGHRVDRLFAATVTTP
jgi:hypothetical protein